MHSTVAKKVNGVVMTSSPSRMPSASMMRNSASVPFAHAMQCLVPTYAATASSRALTRGPPMNAGRAHRVEPDRIEFVLEREVLCLEVEQRDTHMCAVSLSFVPGGAVGA